MLLVALTNTDEIIPTGQMHHILSNKIYDALGKHDVLSGVLGRDSMLVRALDKASHTGYQTWHREYDDYIIEWLEQNRGASVSDFLNELKSVYGSEDMKKRFPKALQVIEHAIKKATGGN
jgi:hypothetical protein